MTGNACDSRVGHGTEPPFGDLVPTLNQRASLVATLANPNLTLARAAATYLLHKRRRLTPATERGYQQILDEFTAWHPKAKLSEFEPPTGTLMIEDFLTQRWGHLEPRTYNKALSVLSDLFAWLHLRDSIHRSPVVGIERARVRPKQRFTFSQSQVAAILQANEDPRDQIALRLLLHWGIRKGALRDIRLGSFDVERRSLTFLTKGQKYQTLPITDELVWHLLEQLGEPGHHYLLCRQKLRKRISPSRAEFAELSDLLGDLEEAALAVTDDKCADQIMRLRLHIDEGFAQLSAAVAEAAMQIRRFPAEPIGEHGAHSWWYRCLIRAGVVAPGTSAGHRMHDARHTAIQRVLDRTQNLKAAAKLAGHASTAVTDAVYTDWSLDQLEGTMREVLA